MTSTLNTLKSNFGSRKKKLRKGRGIAAGQGASCGFGMRGQKSRSGRPTRPGFEGGQMPLYRRVPKLKHFEIINQKNFSIINLEKLYLSLKKLDLYDADLKEYYLLSHSLGIVPKDLNKLKDKLFGIECNFEELNGIDFKKGCYVGQENTARIKLKNKLSKRLFPINLINGKLYEGESIYNNEIEIGKVLIDSDYPFALIKYLNENFDEKANFKTKEASININKPDWIKN